MSALSPATRAVLDSVCDDGLAPTQAVMRHMALEVRATLASLQSRLAAAEAECRAREEVQARLIRERNAAESRVGDLERVLERLTLASETLLSSDPDMPSHADTEREHDAVTDEARALLAPKSRGPEGEVRGG